jgi:hypothetical protein
MVMEFLGWLSVAEAHATITSAARTNHKKRFIGIILTQKTANLTIP